MAASSCLRGVSWGTALVALLLGGCATPSAPDIQGLLSPPKALADAFAPLTVPPKFRAAVRQANYDAALALYGQHGELLEREARSEVDALAAAMNARSAPDLDNAARALNATLEATKPSLDDCKEAIRQAEAVLASYDSQPAMTPARRSAASTSLRQAIQASRGKLQARLPALFDGYEHAAKPPFFEQLPFPVGDEERRALVRQGLGSVEQAMGRSSTEKAAQLARTYGILLEEPQRARLVNAYVKRLAIDKFGRAEGLSPVQGLWLAFSAVEAGGRPPRVMKLKSAGAADLPVTIDGKTVDDAVALEQLPALPRSAFANGDKIVLVIDPAPAATVSELKNPQQLKRRRQNGSRSVPNPRYREAQSRVQDLERELRELEAQNASLQQQAQDLARQSAGRGSGAFAAMLGSFTGLTAVNSARSSLDDARSELASTPRTIEEPVYSEDAVAAWTRETRWVAKPSLYLLSADSPKVHKARIDLEEAASEQVSAPARPDPETTGASRPIALTSEQVSKALQAGQQLATRDLRSAVQADRGEFERTASTLRRQAADRSRNTLRELQAMQAGSSETGGTRSDRSPHPTAAATNVGGCHETLAYLGDRLPRFRVGTLEDVRQSILTTNVRDMIRKAKSEGYTAERAVAAALDAAKSMESQMAVAGSCAAEVDALGTSDDAFLEGIKRGELANIPSCDGIRNSCLCAGLALRLGAVGFRASAAAMQCHARRGQW